MGSPYAKAIYAFVSTFISSLLLVVDDGISTNEWLMVAGAVVAVTGGVFGLRNEPLPLDEPRV